MTIRRSHSSDGAVPPRLPWEQRVAVGVLAALLSVGLTWLLAWVHVVDGMASVAAPRYEAIHAMRWAPGLGLIVSLSPRHAVWSSLVYVFVQVGMSVTATYSHGATPDLGQCLAYVFWLAASMVAAASGSTLARRMAQPTS